MFSPHAPRGQALSPEQVGMGAGAGQPQLIPGYLIYQQPVRGQVALLIARPISGKTVVAVPIR